MSKYCGNCGQQMAQDEKFCAICGTKFESNVIASKKKLTNAVIEKDLTAQKHSAWSFVFQGGLFLAMFILSYWRPGILLLSIPLVITVIRMIRDNTKRTTPKYYLLERKCIEKKIAENDDGPDYNQLWFENYNGTLRVALVVEKEFYDKTTIGEDFYIVFLVKDKTPCLCYRKSEWTNV